MDLSEAEIQVLASLEKARLEGTPTDTRSLESTAERFWVFAEDWTPAYSSLMEKGLVEGSATAYRLTARGLPLARNYHRQRPDQYYYYYQKFYQAAHASDAHSQLCKRVFGEDLCQEGQADMTSLNDLLARLKLQPGEQVLDLGCGAGVISEYVARETGTIVTGIDYSAPAVDAANARTAGHSDRLKFATGDMNHLDLPDNSIDAVISLDTLYWAADLESTLAALKRALRPGGRMGIFLNHHIDDGEDTVNLQPEYSKAWLALTDLGLRFDTIDYTQAICEFWQRLADAVNDLRDAFEAEGNGFIAESLLREANNEYLPDVRAGRISRYLYMVQC